MKRWWELPHVEGIKQMLVWKFCHWCEFLLLQLPLPPMPLPLVEKVTLKSLAPAEVTTKCHPSTNVISSSVSVFTIASLQQYTNSFCEDNFIGEGLLGSVYRADLPDGRVQIHFTDMKWFSWIAIWLFNWFGPQAWLFYVLCMHDIIHSLSDGCHVIVQIQTSTNYSLFHF